MSAINNLNLNNLVTSSDRYSVSVVFGNLTIQLLTVQDISKDHSQTVSNAYAVGTRGPIATKAVNQLYNGTISMESGEYDSLIQALQAEFITINSLMDVSQFSATIAFDIIRVNKDTGWVDLWRSVQFNKDSDKVEKNTTETVVSLGFMATNYNRYQIPS